MAITYLSGQRIQGENTLASVLTPQTTDDSLNFDGDTIKGGMRYTGSADKGKLTEVTVSVKSNTGNTEGLVYCKLYKNVTLDATPPSPIETGTGTFNMDTIGTSYEDKVFTFDGTNELQQYDIISIEFAGDGGDKLNLAWDSNDGTTDWSVVSMYGTGGGSPENEFSNENTGRTFSWTVKTGADEKTTVTDVPTGSQFEETDTRKFYQFDGTDWVERGTAI